MRSSRSHLDLDAVSGLVRDVAAAVHVPYFAQGLVGAEKSPGEPVCVVDQEAERLLQKGLGDLTPGVLVISEEAASADPSLLDALQGDDPVWLVDPLDGTQHFLEGRPDHAVMVALVQAGQTLAAVVHQPQHAATYLAELGGGCWRDGERLHRRESDPTDLSQLRGAVLRRFLDPSVRERLANHEGAFGALTPRSMCAGIEYPRIIESDADFLLFWRTLPWDHAAGALLLTEAGGAALRPDGSSYRVNQTASGLLAASDAATAEAVLRGLGLRAS